MPKRPALPLGKKAKVASDLITIDKVAPDPREEGKFLPPIVEVVERLLPFAVSRAAMVRKLCDRYGVSRARIDAAIAKAKDNYRVVLDENRETRIAGTIAALKEIASAAYKAKKYNAATQAFQLMARLSGDLAPDTLINFNSFNIGDSQAKERAEQLRLKAIEADRTRN